MLQSLIKHIDDLDNEYWEARELMLVLKYSKLEHFAKVINKAKISCKLSGINVNDHFPVIGKTIKMHKVAVLLQNAKKYLRHLAMPGKMTCMMQFLFRHFAACVIRRRGGG